VKTKHETVEQILSRRGRHLAQWQGTTEGGQLGACYYRSIGISFHN